MKYIPPINGDTGDPNRSYVTGNPSTGIEGSQVDGKALEHPQREIAAVIAAAGITASESVLTQLRDAILALIAGGVGELDTLAQFNPVFPDVETSDGLIGVTAAAGQVIVSDGYSFIHRGSQRINTGDTIVGDRTFNTSANKTYHLRWGWNAGSPAFALKDLADLAYNPTGLPEINEAFDTAYDDMLIAKVVTDGSNNATITQLANKARLIQPGADRSVGNGSVYEEDTVPGAIANYVVALTINWARTPRAYLVGFTDVSAEVGSNGEINLGVRVVDRYTVGAYYQRTTLEGGAYLRWAAEA